MASQLVGRLEIEGRRRGMRRSYDRMWERMREIELILTQYWTVHSTLHTGTGTGTGISLRQYASRLNKNNFNGLPSSGMFHDTVCFTRYVSRYVCSRDVLGVLTICLFISPDLDGHDMFLRRVPKMKH